MALFTRNKPVVFRSSQSFSSRRRGVPRWLVVLLVGIVMGAGGVLLGQNSYGPIRLTVAESEQLYRNLNVATLENQHLQEQLDQIARAHQQADSQLVAAHAERDDLRGQLAARQADILALVARLPPDPRGTSPGISAGTLRNLDGKLDYQVLLVQNEDIRSTFTGKMALVVEGVYPNGRMVTLDLPAVDVRIGRYGFVSGQAALPPTFAARQATIRIAPAGQARAVATRTLLVR